MTTTFPSPLVAGPYATYDSPTTSIKWAVAMEDFKTPPTDSDRAGAYEMEVVTEKNKIMTNSMNNISADISMNGQKRRGLLSGSWEQPCARMAHAQQKSASGLP